MELDFLTSIEKYLILTITLVVKIKTFGGMKVFFTDTANTDLGDKPQTRGFFFLIVCIEKWK